MAEEITDKSIVVWHPSLAYRVPDVKEWTSLCLFHDQVVLCTLFWKAEAEYNPFLDYWQTRPDSKERFSFLDKIQFLVKHKTIRLITPWEFCQQVVTDLRKISEPCIPHGLAERFSQFVDQNLKETQLEQDAALEALDLSDAIMSCFTSEAYQYPLVANDVYLKDTLSTQLVEIFLKCWHSL